MKSRMVVFSLMTILILATSSYVLSVSEKTVPQVTLDPGESKLLHKGKINTKDVGKPAYVTTDISGEARGWVHVEAYLIEGVSEKSLSDYHGYGFQITRGQTMYYKLHVEVPLATCPGSYSAQVKWYLNYGSDPKDLVEIVNLSMLITDDMLNEAQQKIDEAEAKIREVQKKGADLSQAVDVLNSAKKFLEDSCNCSMAMNYAQSAITNAEQALKTARSLAREAILGANIVYNKAYELNFNVRDAHNLLYEANLAFEEEQYDTALDKATEVKAMLDSMIDLADNAEKTISEAKAAISQAQGRTITIGNAEELLDQAVLTFGEFKYQEALDLAQQAVEEVAYWTEKYNQAQEEIQNSELCIKNTQKGAFYVIKPQVNRSLDALDKAKKFFEETDYDSAKVYATDACSMATEAEEASREFTNIFWAYLLCVVLGLTAASFKLY